jgi:dihydroorotate dehydrogenase
LTSILSAVVDAANATDRQIKPVVMVKISPDEDSDAQVRGICDAIWESGVAGVIVGNTTMKRPDPLPLGYQLPTKDAQAALETGGYSGPQLFERTKRLVAKYRKALDEGPSSDISQPSNPAVTTEPQAQEKSSDPNEQVKQQVEASVTRDLKSLKPLDSEIANRPRTESSDENLPLIRLPERHQSSNTGDVEAGKAPGFQAITSQSAATSTEPFTGKPSPKVLGGGKSKAFDSPSKVIFASGGIVNGEQALEVLNAGASVAMCYTGVVYGGVGTLSRIKGEMREKMAAGQAARR